MKIYAAMLVLALACLPGATAASAADDDDMTRIRVEVKNLDEKPIERASVVVRFVQGRSVKKLGRKVIKSWEMKTNQEGVAKMPPLPQGEILVQVIAKNYQTFGERFTINEPEKTIEVTLNPPQPQYSVHQ
jgi:hypothetical protein